MLVSQETHGGYNGPVAGEILPVVRSRGPAFEAITLPILCPKFLGTEFAEGQCAVFLEHSVSQNLGHRICDTSLMLTPTVRSHLPVDGWRGWHVRCVRSGSLSAESVVSGVWGGSGRWGGTVCIVRRRVGRESRGCVPGGLPDRAGGSGRPVGGRAGGGRLTR